MRYAVRYDDGSVWLCTPDGSTVGRRPINALWLDRAIADGRASVHKRLTEHATVYQVKDAPSGQ